MDGERETVEAAIQTVENHNSKVFGRILRGIGSTGLIQLIYAANGILLVPLFIHAWGASQYGRWLTLTSLVTYLTLFDLGGQSYFSNLLAAEHARGDVDAFRRRFSQGLSLFSLIAMVALFVLGLVCSLPNRSSLILGFTFGVEDRLVLLFVGATFIVGIPGGILAGAYRASGLYVRGVMIGNIWLATNLVLNIYMLASRVSPAIYASFGLVSCVAINVLLVFDSRRHIPGVCEGGFSWASARAGSRHLPGALFFWLLSLSNALNQQGVIIVLAITGTSSGVALFATHRTICGLINYIGGFVQGPLLPELNYLFTRQQRELLAKASHLAMKLVTQAASLAGVGLWMLLPFVYSRWTGKRLAFDAALLAILLTQAVLAAGWQCSGWALLASNQHRRLSCWALANGLITVGLAAILAPHWGVHGVALASLLGDILCGLAIYPTLASRALGLSRWTIYKTILPPVAALIPLWVAAIFIKIGRASGFEFTCLLVLVSLALILLSSFLSFRKKDDFDWILRRLQSNGG
jgi:O-antigen/teichoic acid export membrane protein